MHRVPRNGVWSRQLHIKSARRCTAHLLIPHTLSQLLQIATQLNKKQPKKELSSFVMSITPITHCSGDDMMPIASMDSPCVIMSEKYGTAVHFGSTPKKEKPCVSMSEQQVSSAHISLTILIKQRCTSILCIEICYSRSVSSLMHAHISILALLL